NRLDTDDPTTDVTVWPLFGIERGERLHYLTFLWPFFRFRSERFVERDADGLPYEEVYYRHDFLWPLYQKEHLRGGVDHLRVLPFYSRYESNHGTNDGISSRCYAIPLFWVRQVRDKDWVKDTFDFVPIVHQETKHFRSGGREDSAFKLW